MQLSDISNNTTDIPRFEDGTKLTAEDKLELWTLIKKDPTLPSTAILERTPAINATIRHINRLRVEWRLSRPKGRPRKSDAGSHSAHLPVPVNQKRNSSHVGVHLFSFYMEMEDEFSMILEQLKLAIEFYVEENPTASFPLLSHGDDTLMRRFKALFYAPLFQVGKLIEYDVKEHALETVIGRGYQSSTLNQHLGQLERIDVAPWLKNSLIPLDIHGGAI